MIADNKHNGNRCSFCLEEECICQVIGLVLQITEESLCLKQEILSLKEYIQWSGFEIQSLTHLAESVNAGV